VPHTPEMSNHPKATLWFKAAPPRPGSRARLFCFPYAGGSAAIFRDWARGLPPEIEVCPATLPGRGHRMFEPPSRRISEVVEQLAQAITPYLDKPFAFYGHSMGALLAFDLARRLRDERGVEPALLIVSGSRAPQLPDRSPPPHDAPEEEFIDYLRRLNGTPEEVFQNAELLNLLMPLLRADLEAVSTYDYAGGEPLGCPVTAYGGLSDPSVSREDIAAWRGETRSDFLLRMFEGDHFFIHQSAPLLLKSLARDLVILTGGGV
jgi:medium-chain acyl-[acyl-carrier-protein] hydrolase